ncbi:MAG: GGDEF domain-containing protein [Kangiellaceae bacterium]|nr:GGDEF domain-containing protein [Kangiellaceae bacterium]
MQDKLTIKLRARIVNNTMLAMLAYSIVIFVGVMSVFLDLSYYGYKPFVSISFAAIFLNILYLLITYTRIRIDGRFANRMLITQIVTWFFTFSAALFFMAEIRAILLLSSVMATTFVFSYQSFKSSIVITLLIAACYVLMSYIGIFKFNQPGKFSYDLLIICCFVPACIFIAYMAERVTRQRDLLSQTKRELECSIIERQSILKKLEIVAATDDLTGLLNRRAINQHLEKEHERSKRNLASISVLLIDIDHFKSINDTYGHLAGDRVLQQLSETLKASIREVDYLARWGGEEFLVLMPDTDSSAAMVLAKRIQTAIKDAVITYKQNKIRLTMSGGLVELSANEAIKDGLLKADELLYKAKELGRNKVMSAT